MKLSCANLTLDLSRMGPLVMPEPDKIDRALAKAKNWLNGSCANDSENRPAMHMALRASNSDFIPNAFLQPVIEEKVRQKSFVESCNATHIVHIGIGGSDLGPRLAVAALQGSGNRSSKQVSFLASLTPEAIERSFKDLNPQKSLVIIASKSFGTDEIKYIINVLFQEYSWPKDRIVISTAHPDKAIELGISAENTFPFWDWVGGRYSVWSSVGMVIALTYGWSVFDAFLKGAARIDAELYADLESAAPWQLALHWHSQRVMNHRPGLAFLPYHTDLALLPAYCQQLIMESNGKPGSHTAPIVFGSPGTEFQHSFGQFLHQGPDLCTSLFIAFDQFGEGWQGGARSRLMANALAQADTLWQGKTDTNPAKSLPGGRPSAFITAPTLNADTLGQLLALFEHATVLDGFLSDINPFDQYGVEAGKLMAQERLKIGS